MAQPSGSTSYSFCCRSREQRKSTTGECPVGNFVSALRFVCHLSHTHKLYAGEMARTKKSAVRHVGFRYFFRWCDCHTLHFFRFSRQKGPTSFCHTFFPQRTCMEAERCFLSCSPQATTRWRITCPLGVDEAGELSKTMLCTRTSQKTILILPGQTRSFDLFPLIIIHVLFEGLSSSG